MGGVLSMAAVTDWAFPRLVFGRRRSLRTICGITCIPWGSVSVGPFDLVLAPPKPPPTPIFRLISVIWALYDRILTIGAFELRSGTDGGGTR